MNPHSSHIQQALASGREADVRRHVAGRRHAARRAQRHIPSELFAAGAVVPAVAVLIALGAPLGA